MEASAPDKGEGGRPAHDEGKGRREGGQRTEGGGAPRRAVVRVTEGEEARHCAGEKGRGSAARLAEGGSGLRLKTLKSGIYVCSELGLLG